jgi:hypothetical protein
METTDRVLRNNLMWRWPLVSAGFIGAFWLVWHLIAGSVPVVTSLEMTEAWSVALPFGISHWWDILLGPLFVCVLIYLYFRVKDINKDVATALAVAPAFGLFYGLCVRLVVGWPTALFIGLLAGLIFGLVWLIKAFLSSKILRVANQWFFGK